MRKTLLFVKSIRLVGFQIRLISKLPSLNFPQSTTITTEARPPWTPLFGTRPMEDLLPPISSRILLFLTQLWLCLPSSLPIWLGNRDQLFGVVSSLFPSEDDLSQLSLSFRPQTLVDNSSSNSKHTPSQSIAAWPCSYAAFAWGRRGTSPPVFLFFYPLKSVRNPKRSKFHDYFSFRLHHSAPYGGGYLWWRWGCFDGSFNLFYPRYCLFLSLIPGS